MDAQYIINTTYRMKEGQCFDLSLRDVRRVFPANWLTGESSLDRLKTNIIGSAHSFIFDVNKFEDKVTIQKINPDGKIRHVDYDRKHFYEENSDGTYTRNSLEYRSIQ